MKRTTQQNIESKGGADLLAASPRNEIYLILDNIRSMHNIGAIFRTCEAARAKCLYLCGITATPPRPQIAKTALNTVDHQPWEYRHSTLRLAKTLKRRGIQVVALEQTSDSIDFRHFVYQKPLAIVLGNEIDGVSDRVLEVCDGIVELPMLGIANSLNVATSAGIILYHLLD